MLDQKPLSKLLFLDIETTSQKESFFDLTERQQNLFKKRFKKDIESKVTLQFAIATSEKQKKEESAIEPPVLKKGTKKKTTPTSSTEEMIQKITENVCVELYNTKAPIHCEFSRVLCISVGVMWKNDGDDFYNIKITSFYDEDEKKILFDFVNHPKLGVILDKLPGKFEKNRNEYWAIVGHNISVFDLPVLSKRMIINEIKPPAMFDVSHLKSWDLTDVVIDTKSAWSYNVFDNSTSLDLLCEIFNVPSSKDDIDGSEVKNIFWIEKDLPRIVKYCEKDVLALAQVYLKMKSMPEEVRLFVQQPAQPYAETPAPGGYAETPAPGGYAETTNSVVPSAE